MASERKRLEENREGRDEAWYDWGTYLSERQWGTVREDYSADGAAWEYLPHDHARSRAYRWGEDGLLGWCDRHGKLNFSIALWNGVDPILKERLFGLTNSEGNHGEDVKELYYFLDGLPSAAYMKALYKYPKRAYPYAELVAENARRSKLEREYEITDTDAFADGCYDVVVEYAKSDPRSTAVRITVTNQSEHEGDLTLVPQLWFRNTWSWKAGGPAPRLMAGAASVECEHPDFGRLHWRCEGTPTVLFTENETNAERLFGGTNPTPYVKDAFHRYVVEGDHDAVDPARRGSKAGVLATFRLQPGERQVLRLELGPDVDPVDPDKVDALFEERIKEADAFYADLSPGLPADVALVQRQAFAGLIWSKQFYHYDVETWLVGDPLQPPPPPERLAGRNARWRHVHTAELFAMPDTWEYPWFAAWDLAFHAVTFALVDSEFAKQQLVLLEREWLMHPNGQAPAYEWAFGDVNPPVHAWAAYRVYTIERRLRGVGDVEFLERVFHKLLLNFTWWVNRKDDAGDNVFEGGFLGLDNIGMFDRNTPLADGETLEQSDGTSWMAIYCLQLLTIALELAQHDHAYEDVASKFFEHFLYIAKAMNDLGTSGTSLWDEEDGFFYDTLHRRDGSFQKVRVRSAVGIIPLFAVAVLEHADIAKFTGFQRRMDWFLEHRPDLVQYVASMVDSGQAGRRLLSLVDKTQLQRVLSRILDPAEFLSDFGVRALSKTYASRPYSFTVGGMTASIDYEPAESTTGAFGGNSNWRGPIWMPLNYLLIEALQLYDYYYGDQLKVEMPHGSGESATLGHVAAELESRLLKIFLHDERGDRPVHDGLPLYRRGELGGHLVLFYEYFSGENGRGVGASHQTGWTALIAKIINQLYVTAYSDRVT